MNFSMFRWIRCADRQPLALGQPWPRRRSWLWALVGAIALWSWATPAGWADAIDPYVRRYLQPDTAALRVDASGKLKSFSAEALSAGKQIFGESCLNCHVGGSTLANPLVSLSLTDLAGATPPRDTLAGLVAYMRHPLTYDGSDENYYCREVPETWLSDGELENVAAFVLRAAELAPGWGGDRFSP